MLTLVNSLMIGGKDKTRSSIRQSVKDQTGQQSFQYMAVILSFGVGCIQDLLHGHLLAIVRGTN